MRSNCVFAILGCYWFLASGALCAAAPLDLLPTPRFLESLKRQITIRGSVRVHSPHGDLRATRRILTQSCPNVAFDQAQGFADANIVLWNYAAASPPVSLSYLD